MSKSPRKASSCESCGAQFSSISILKNHVDSECSTKKRFRCNFCEALFMTKYSLKTHEKTKHIESGVKKFKCGFCEKVFASKGQVKVHERMHTKEKAFKCGICEKAFSHRESLVTHSTLHTGMKPYACQCCHAQFSCIGNLIKHRRIRPETCGDPIYKNEKVRSRAGVKIVENESQIILRENDSSQSAMETFDTSEVEYISVYDIDRGNEEEEEEEQQDPGSENIESVEKITRYENEEGMIVGEEVVKDDMVEGEDFKVEFLVDIDNEDYIIEEEQENENCKSDNDNFGFEEIIEEDDTMENDDDVGNDEMFEEIPEVAYEEYTDELEEEYQDDDDVSDSFEPTTEEMSDEISAHIDIRGNQYLCKLCPKQYQKRKAAFNHIRSDHNVFEDRVMLEERKRKTKTETFFSCNICTKKFAYQNLWRNHLKLHGTDGKLIHKCNCCPVHFATLNDMQNHLFEEHIDELKCPVESCDKIFDSSMKLKKHVKFSHADNKKLVKKYEFVCEQCGKVCKSTSSLNDHVRSNCGRDPIYQCDSCEKFFRSMGSLKCHKTIHSNVLDFECTFCLKRFRTKGQLTVHLRSHTKEKAFHCQYCPASFSHRESLITHNTVHTGIKRFRCSVCDAGFSCLSNFFTHRKNHSSCSHAQSIKVKEAETSVKSLTYPSSQIVEVEEVVYDDDDDYEDVLE